MFPNQKLKKTFGVGCQKHKYYRIHSSIEISVFGRVFDSLLIESQLHGATFHFMGGE